MDKENVYSTRDLTLAAVLVSLKFPLQGVDLQIEGGRGQTVGYFKFDNTPEVQDAAQKFLQGMITLEPGNFMQTVRTLKAQVSNLTRNPLG